MGEEGDYKTNATLQRFKRTLLGQDKTSKQSFLFQIFIFILFFIATLSRFINREGQSHKIKSTNHNLSEEKGEPKRNRTEALLLTCHSAKQAHETGRVKSNVVPALTDVTLTNLLVTSEA